MTEERKRSKSPAQISLRWQTLLFSKSQVFIRTLGLLNNIFRNFSLRDCKDLYRDSVRLANSKDPTEVTSNFLVKIHTGIAIKKISKQNLSLAASNRLKRAVPAKYYSSFACHPRVQNFLKIKMLSRLFSLFCFDTYQLLDNFDDQIYSYLREAALKHEPADSPEFPNTSKLVSLLLFCGKTEDYCCFRKKAAEIHQKKSSFVLSPTLRSSTLRVT